MAGMLKSNGSASSVTDAWPAPRRVTMTRPGRIGAGCERGAQMVAHAHWREVADTAAASAWSRAQLSQALDRVSRLLHEDAHQVPGGHRASQRSRLA